MLINLIAILMFDVGGGELILIVLAILVLFGPERMPEIARMMKKGMAKVRQAQLEFQNQIEEIQQGLDIENEIKQPFTISPVVLDDYQRALETDEPTATPSNSDNSESAGCPNSGQEVKSDALNEANPNSEPNSPAVAASPERRDVF